MSKYEENAKQSKSIETIKENNNVVKKCNGLRVSLVTGLYNYELKG